MSTPIFDNLTRKTPASPTPNIVIPNPKVRAGIRTALDSIGGAAVIAEAVDLASPAFDLGWLIYPVLAGYAMARVVFGFAVDTPNTPAS